MVRSPVWEGDHPLSATYRYSSGSLHAAWDIACPIGTKVYACRDGYVIDSRTGVRDNRPGYNPGPGAASNYVLLGFEYKDRPASLYHQHLTRAVVHDGQRVRAGELIGYSGNTGFSTGPHLHLSAQWGHSANRYLYLVSSAARIYPPALVWQDLPPQWPGEERMRRAVRGHEYEFVRDMKKALVEKGHDIDNPKSARYGGSAQEAMKTFKRHHRDACEDPGSAYVGPRCWRALSSL